MSNRRFCYVNTQMDRSILNNSALQNTKKIKLKNGKKKYIDSHLTSIFTENNLH